MLASRAWICGWAPQYGEILSPFRTRRNTAIDGLHASRACWDHWIIQAMPPSTAAQGTGMSALGISVIKQNAELKQGPSVWLVRPVLTACGLLLSLPAAAASQGASTAASRGSVTITASVAPRAAFAGRAVWSVAGEERSLLELRCLRLTSLTGGYYLSAMDPATGQPGLAAGATSEPVAAAGLSQSRAACRMGADARWLIGPLPGRTAAERPQGLLVRVLLAPL